MRIEAANFFFKAFFAVSKNIFSLEASYVNAFLRSGQQFFVRNNVIKCHLSRLMGERKLKVAEVARATGLYRGSVSLLYDETASKVDLETIDKLCAYFGVTVGELFEQVAPLPDLVGGSSAFSPGAIEQAATRKR